MALQGYSDIQLTLVTPETALETISTVLVAAGWSAPETRLAGMRIAAHAVAELDWPTWAATLGPRERIISWDTVTAQHREDFTRRRKADPHLFPHVLNPFHRAINHNPETSLALIQDERLMGWLITHAISSDILGWTVSYVLPPLEHKARVLALWRETLNRQISLTEYTHIQFDIRHDAHGMLRLIQKRLKPLNPQVNMTLLSRFGTAS
jgi:hypothetical protein